MSQSASPHFQIELHDQVLVIQFIATQLYEHLVLDEVDHELKDAIADYRPRHVVFDFSHVDFSSSSLISAMLRTRSKIKGRGGVVAIANLKPDVRDAMRVLALDRTTFSTYESTRAAVEQLQRADDEDTADE